jgi:hypothetical protein
VQKPGGRTNLAILELLDELGKLATKPPAANPAFPFVLAAGARPPAWRRTS